MDTSINQNEVKALLYLLDDEDLEVQKQVKAKISSIGEAIIPFLEKEWESNMDAFNQRKIENLIHTLQFDLLKKRLVEWKNTEQQDLLTGLWLVATYQYPDLELSKLKSMLEELYYEAWLDMRDDLEPHDQIRLLNNIIFSKLKFSGNTKNYYSPANSMINMVLESKRGNHISLSMVYLLIAQKLKLPIFGVNLPIIFVLTFKTTENQFYINAFNKGIVFSKNDISNFLDQQHLEPQPSYFEPCTSLEIIKRMLRNLIVAFEKQGETEKQNEVKELIQTITDLDISELL
ncbi:MAG: transglutaminase-like domain-containing protein [Cytophagales bacterium]